jgi:hypothetical protein
MRDIRGVDLDRTDSVRNPLGRAGPEDVHHDLKPKLPGVLEECSPLSDRQLDALEEVVVVMGRDDQLVGRKDLEVDHIRLGPCCGIDGGPGQIEGSLIRLRHLGDDADALEEPGHARIPAIGQLIAGNGTAQRRSIAS